MDSDPVALARAIERHLRNSHAIGKLIVDGVWTRLVGGGSPTRRGGDAPAATPPDAGSTVEAPVTGLPLAEAEWALLSSGDVVYKIDECDDATVRAIGDFEESHRRRRLVIEAVRRRLGS